MVGRMQCDLRAYGAKVGTFCAKVKFTVYSFTFSHTFTLEHFCQTFSKNGNKGEKCKELSKLLKTLPQAKRHKISLLSLLLLLSLLSLQFALIYPNLH